eukprot:15364857-Ditylum_brightwellii.AAC.2
MNLRTGSKRNLAMHLCCGEFDFPRHTGTEWHHVDVHDVCRDGDIVMEALVGIVPFFPHLLHLIHSLTLPPPVGGTTSWFHSSNPSPLA